MSSQPGKIFHANVVGVTSANRQAIIQKIQPADPITLLREPDNPYNKNAVAVYWSNQQIGYLDREPAKDVGQGMDRARITSLPASVAKITGEGGAAGPVGLSINFSLPPGTFKPQRSVWFIGFLWGLAFTFPRIICVGVSAVSAPLTGDASFLTMILPITAANFAFYWLTATLLVYLNRTHRKAVVVAGILLLGVIVLSYLPINWASIILAPQPMGYTQPTAAAPVISSPTEMSVAPTPNPFLTAQAKPGDWTCTITDNVSVRNKPAMDGDEVQVLQQGDCIEIIGKSQDGKYLQTTNGWVWAASVSTTSGNTRGSYLPNYIVQPHSVSGLQPPDFGRLVATNRTKNSSDLDQNIAGHARNLAIAAPYDWEFYNADSLTRFRDVETYYRDLLVGMGYQMTFNEEGLNDIYLLKFKQDQKIVTIQFWAANGTNGPAFLIFYQGNSQ